MLNPFWSWLGALDRGSVDESELAKEDLRLVAPPPGLSLPEDVAAVRKALMWRAEVMRENQSWWRDEFGLAATDAIYFAASDLAQAIEYQPDETDVRRVFEAKARTITRLSGIAQRLSESGGAADASRLDTQVDALRFGGAASASYIPTFRSWGILHNTRDDIIRAGRSPLTVFREELAWLTAQLRERKIKVNSDGDPTDENAPAAEAYRWQPLFASSETAEGAWNRRFEVDSWFRRLMKMAASELKKTKLGQLASSSDSSS
jgi:hypothetical protein